MKIVWLLICLGLHGLVHSGPISITSWKDLKNKLNKLKYVENLKKLNHSKASETMQCNTVMKLSR